MDLIAHQQQTGRIQKQSEEIKKRFSKLRGLPISAAHRLSESFELSHYHVITQPADSIVGKTFCKLFAVIDDLGLLKKKSLAKIVCTINQRISHRRYSSRVNATSQ